MISVIIPLYNKEDSIYESISSVLKQTFKDFELLIINDGSTDKSLEIVNSFDDSRIKCYSQINSGVSHARNIGVDKSQFNYVAFLDGDDLWEQNYLDILAEQINNFPEANFYATLFKIRTEKKDEIPSFGFPLNFKKGIIDYFEILSKNLNCSCLHTSAIVFERDFFLKMGGFNTEVKMGEDMLFWLKASINGTCAYYNEALCVYNQVSNPMNRAVNKFYKPENFYVFHFDELEKNQKINKKTKDTLDQLRLKNLKKYYINPLFSDQVITEIKKVDQKDLFHAIFYSFPPFLLKFFYFLWISLRKKNKIG